MQNGRPQIRIARLKRITIDALDARCWGRRAEFYRRHLAPIIDQQLFYRACRQEPVTPEVVVAIEKAVQQIAK